MIMKEMFSVKVKYITIFIENIIFLFKYKSERDNIS